MVRSLFSMLSKCLRTGFCRRQFTVSYYSYFTYSFTIYNAISQVDIIIKTVLPLLHVVFLRLRSVRKRKTVCVGYT